MTRKIMPRPEISDENIQVINSIIATHSDFTPAELSTDSKLRYCLNQLERYYNQRGRGATIL
jgi:hypothetical protein